VAIASASSIHSAVLRRRYGGSGMASVPAIRCSSVSCSARRAVIVTVQPAGSAAAVTAAARSAAPLATVPRTA
jgi:hypothetical protein